MMRYFVPIMMLLVEVASADVVAVAAKTSTISMLSKKELKESYLKKQQFSNGVKLVPINLPAGTPTRVLFEKAVLRMDEAELGEYWNEKHYNGVNPPMVQNSQIAVKAMVKKVHGAIGYIDEELLDDGLKIIGIIK